MDMGMLVIIWTSDSLVGWPGSAIPPGHPTRAGACGAQGCLTKVARV